MNLCLGAIAVQIAAQYIEIQQENVAILLMQFGVAGSEHCPDDRVWLPAFERGTTALEWQRASAGSHQPRYHRR